MTEMASVALAPRFRSVVRGRDFVAVLTDLAQHFFQNLTQQANREKIHTLRVRRNCLVGTNVETARSAPQPFSVYTTKSFPWAFASEQNSCKVEPASPSTMLVRFFLLSSLLLNGVVDALSLGRGPISWQQVGPGPIPDKMAGISCEIHRQVGGTCYAHAVATALRAAESRIVGREPSPHADIVASIVGKHGDAGESVGKVLAEECPKRQLRWRQVSESDARKAAEAGRVLVATFYLTDAGWDAFSKHFGETPRNPFLDKDGKGRKEGHAVAVRGFIDGYGKNSRTQELGILRYVELKNSWGGSFADGGFFRVALDAIEFTFYDVFFFERDLLPADRANFLRAQGHHLYPLPEEDQVLCRGSTCSVQ